MDAAVVVTAPAGPVAAGHVGPNAVIQLVAALRAEGGDGLARRISARAGLAHLIGDPPAGMIDEAVPAAFFAALWREMPPAAAARLASEAGRRTADYVIANRIPWIAKAAVRLCPVRMTMPALPAAIERSAWTFVGSGTLGVATRPTPAITIVGNRLATPGCVWHRAAFERLFRRLVTPDARVSHVACLGRGDGACRFEISL